MCQQEPYGTLFITWLIEGNGYETHSSIFLFTFFNHDPAQNEHSCITMDNGPMKTFGSGQSSIINEHKTKDCAALRSSRCAPLSAPLKFAEFHNLSPLLTMILTSKNKSDKLKIQ